MTVVYLSFFLLFWTVNSEIIIEEEPSHKNLCSCVVGILENYFNHTEALTYVNLSEDEDVLLQDLYAAKLSLLNKQVDNHTDAVNKAYFITARDDTDFNEAPHLTHEQFWNPNARFIIVIKILSQSNLRIIFDVLLKLRVRNVIVVNGTETAELYSFNPYENNACGNYYSKIIEYGQCLQVKTDLYPKKEKSLSGCFFRVAVPHSPPFSVNPEVLDYETVNLGAEQYVFDMISQTENFTYNFSYNINPEVFSVISSNMSVTGPLVIVQNNETDVMLGGMFLTTTRFNKFSVVYGHLDNIDEIKVIVRMATESPPWKNFYLEFTPLVWFLLLISLIFYSLLLIFVLKPNDRGAIIMILLDNLLQHGTKLKSESFRDVRVFFIIWVWFTYLMNCYYQSSLVSLTTKPSSGYQIQTEQEIRNYGLKPCLSPVMVGFNLEEELNLDKVVPDKALNGCDSLLHSIKRVSEYDDLYTIVPRSIYLYNENDFENEYGESLVYVFPKTQSHIIYGIYFNKGFPFLHRFIKWVLRFSETGLITKNVDDIFYERDIKYILKFKEFTNRFAVPWRIYGVGVLLSCIVFVFEILLKYWVDRDVVTYYPYIE